LYLFWLSYHWFATKWDRNNFEKIVFIFQNFNDNLSNNNNLWKTIIELEILMILEEWKIERLAFLNKDNTYTISSITNCYWRYCICVVFVGISISFYNVSLYDLVMLFMKYIFCILITLAFSKSLYPLECQMVAVALIQKILET